MKEITCVIHLYTFIIDGVLKQWFCKMISMHITWKIVFNCTVEDIVKTIFLLHYCSELPFSWCWHQDLANMWYFFIYSLFAFSSIHYNLYVFDHDIYHSLIVFRKKNAKVISVLNLKVLLLFFYSSMGKIKI